MLCRDNEHIYINGVAFGMRRKGTAVLNPQGGQIGSLFDSASSATHAETIKGGGEIGHVPSVSYEHYEDDIELLCEDVDALKRDIDRNLFASAEDKALTEKHVQELYKKVALCRVDIRKLLYNED